MTRGGRRVDVPWTLVRGALVLSGLALLMAWLGGAFAGGRLAPGRVPLAAVPPPERRHVVAAEDLPLYEIFEGEVRSARTTLLAARVGSPIVTLLPRAGDRVARGEAYGTLEPTPFEARLAVTEAAAAAAARSREIAAARLRLAEQARAAAEAALELARKEHGRVAGLVATGASTASELDVAVARLRQAEAGDAEALTAIDVAAKTVAEAEATAALRAKEVELARIERGFTTLRSEVDGIVVRRLLEPGSFAAPGAPILEIHDPRALRLDVPVRERLVPGLDRDAEHEVTLPALGESVRCRIVEVVPSAEEGSRSVRIRFGLPEREALLPGMSGAVTLKTAVRRALTIPEEAVVRVGQLAYADVIGEGRVARRFLRTGRRVRAGWIEVLDGLSAGEVVALPDREAGDGR